MRIHTCGLSSGLIAVQKSFQRGDQFQLLRMAERETGRAIAHHLYPRRQGDSPVLVAGSEKLEACFRLGSDALFAGRDSEIRLELAAPLRTVMPIELLFQARAKPYFTVRAVAIPSAR